LGGRDEEDLRCQPQANSSRDSISKIPKTENRAGRVAQVVEHLSSKCEALSSNPKRGRGKRENNGRGEPDPGTLYAYMEMPQ
jgi:plasmid stabilization system protein ParE